MTTKPTTQYVGIDIAKRSLEVDCPSWTQAERRPSTSPADLQALAKRLQQIPAVFVVFEASGGYEKPLIEVLVQAQIPFAQVNARRVRDFARAQGILAKTDQIDAKAITSFGEKLKPKAMLAHSLHQKELAELNAYRSKLLEDHHREKMQLEYPKAKPLTALIKRSVRAIEARLWPE